MTLPVVDKGFNAVSEAPTTQSGAEADNGAVYAADLAPPRANTSPSSAETVTAAV